MCGSQLGVVVCSGLAVSSTLDSRIRSQNCHFAGFLSVAGFFGVSCFAFLSLNTLMGGLDAASCSAECQTRSVLCAYNENNLLHTSFSCGLGRIHEIPTL
jgi:hypothetical protein